MAAMTRKMAGSPVTHLRGPQNPTRGPAKPTREARMPRTRPLRLPQETPGAPARTTLLRGLVSGSACRASGGRLWTLGVALVGFGCLGWSSGGSSKNPPP